MTFKQQQIPTITGFGDVSLSLFIPGVSNTEGEQSGEINIQLKKSNGQIDVVSDDLMARFQDDPEGETHAIALMSAIAYIIARIPGEVLP